MDALLAFDWLDGIGGVEEDEHESSGSGEEVAVAYRGLMENLVSAHAFYVRPVVKSLVGLLRTGKLPIFILNWC